MPSQSLSFEIEHNGQFYSVEADVDIGIDDQSFDHEFGTEEVFGCELEDCSHLSVHKHLEDGSTEEVDEDKIEGLFDAIWDKLDCMVAERDPSDYSWDEQYDTNEEKYDEY